MIVSPAGNVAVHTMQDTIDIYHYSPEQGISHLRHGESNVSIPISNGSDIVVASCADDDAIILAGRYGVIRVYELSSGRKICITKTDGREYLIRVLQGKHGCLLSTEIYRVAVRTLPHGSHHSSR